MRLRLVAALAAVLAVAPASRAQRATARLEGTVTDSMYARPLAGAMVFVTRNSPDPAAWYSLATDERGRYRLDTLLAGKYSVGLWHPILDSLELVLPPRVVEIGEGQRVVLDLALPSSATLRASLCPGVTLPPGTGALFGQVRDADSDRPRADAVVAVRWGDFTVDRARLQVSRAERTEGLRTNAEGQYRLCGLPTDSWLQVQVQHAGGGGSVVRVSIADSVGVAALNLSFSAAGARRLAPGDSVTGDDAAPLPPLSGTASVSGKVLGDNGQPLAGVQLRVLETAGSMRTDSTGHYTLSGLPAGTQLLEAKRIGYRIVQQPVRLLRGREIEATIRLQRIVSLDSIRIVAQRARYREFEQNRRSASGRFLTERDIAQRNAFQSSDLLRMIPGFHVVGNGFDAKIVSSRGPLGLSRRDCEVNIVIDGLQHQDINFVQPSDIGAMEVYNGPAGAPLLYAGQCGVIVIWTKR